MNESEWSEYVFSFLMNEATGEVTKVPNLSPRVLWYLSIDPKLWLVSRLAEVENYLSLIRCHVCKLQCEVLNLQVSLYSSSYRAIRSHACKEHCGVVNRQVSFKEILNVENCHMVRYDAKITAVRYRLRIPLRGKL